MGDGCFSGMKVPGAPSPAVLEGIESVCNPVKICRVVPGLVKNFKNFLRDPRMVGHT
jgi:hypothetical protein